MNNLRKAIDTHPLPWFFGALLASFGAGVSAYQAVLSWSGMKVVRDEASSKLAIRIEASPAGAKVALSGDAEKFFQGMPLPAGLNVFSVERDGYRPQTIRIAKSGDTLVLSTPLVRIPKIDLTGAPAYSKDRLSLNFQNIEVRPLIQVIADFASQKGEPLNIVFGPDVKGSITIQLKEVPWDLALSTVAAHAGFTLRTQGNVIFVDLP